MITPIWEMIEHTKEDCACEATTTKRLKIEGGWLYKHEVDELGEDDEIERTRRFVVFVPSDVTINLPKL